jgi:hypothetical protein
MRIAGIEKKTHKCHQLNYLQLMFFKKAISTKLMLNIVWWKINSCTSLTEIYWKKGVPQKLKILFKTINFQKYKSKGHIKKWENFFHSHNE